MSVIEAPTLERDPTMDQSVDVDTFSTVAVLAEYDEVTNAAMAADELRKAGYRKFDLHSPFPIHGVERYVGIRMTILPWIVLCGGLTGLTTATLLTHYTMAVEIPILENFSGYQFLISGKPFFSTPAFIPPMFELTILFSAFASVFGMLLLNGLPMHYNPLLRNHRFKRVTDDRFFVVVESTDPKFDEVETIKLLRGTHPVALERVED